MHAYISLAEFLTLKLCMGKILGIIPARYGSSRFPGKPLVRIQEKTMIRRVWEQASQAKSLAALVVATDDERIVQEVLSFGGKVVLTDSSHPTGTDRCREALEKMEAMTGETYAAAINIQGDEPFIDPAQIDLVASCFETLETQLASLVKRLSQTEDLFNPSIIKVVRTKSGNALYFSRSPIPHVRGVEEANWLEKNLHYKHIGIYGYRRDILHEITQLPQADLELAESLEQLRWLENGYEIQLKETHTESRSVDTPEDLKHFNK